LLVSDVKCIPNQAYQILEALDSVLRWIDALAEVLVVIKVDVIHMNAQALRVINVAAESVSQQMQFKPEGHESPIIESKVFEERHATTHIGDILNTKHIQTIKVNFGVLWFFLFFFHWCCLRFFRLFFFVLFFLFVVFYLFFFLLFVFDLVPICGSLFFFS